MGFATELTLLSWRSISPRSTVTGPLSTGSRHGKDDGRLTDLVGAVLNILVVGGTHEVEPAMVLLRR